MDEVTERKHRRLAPWTIVTAVIVATALAATGVLMWLRSNGARPDDGDSALTTSIVQQIDGFTPYFFPDGVPFGFKANATQISYEDNVLFIPLTSREGKTIVLTQQPLPAEFSKASDLVGDEKVAGVDGKAVISHREGRTIGTFVPVGKKTMVIISGPTDVSTTTVADLLRALKPIAADR